MVSRTGAKFIPDKHIETAAFNLLVDYGLKFGPVTTPPIPVDSILECHLGLGFEIVDLREKLNTTDVLGAINISDREVSVDQSLDPSTFPGQFGRFNFTVAHETGHWVLHRGDVLTGQSLFGGKPGLICRNQSKDFREIQADKFAAYLLMPEDMVRKCWSEVYDGAEPYVAIAEIADKSAQFKLGKGDIPILDISKKIAQVFAVSGQAMQIRLMKLGLIATKQPEPSLFL